MQGDGQRSSAQSTLNGIQALESALAGIQRSRQDVDSTRGDLSRGWGGKDGGAFGRLLTEWDGHCTKIESTLKDMIEKLRMSLTQHQRTQAAADDAVAQASAFQSSGFQDTIAQTLSGR